MCCKEHDLQKKGFVFDLLIFLTSARWIAQQNSYDIINAVLIFIILEQYGVEHDNYCGQTFYLCEYFWSPNFWFGGGGGVDLCAFRGYPHPPFPSGLKILCPPWIAGRPGRGST